MNKVYLMVRYPLISSQQIRAPVRLQNESEGLLSAHMAAGGDVWRPAGRIPPSAAARPRRRCQTSSQLNSSVKQHFYYVYFCQRTFIISI